jgi:hypothetical protein
MSEWKARIVSVSEIDQGNQVEICYQVLVNDKVIYPQCRITCSPDRKEVESRIISFMKSIKDSQAKISDIKIGMEVELPK